MFSLPLYVSRTMMDSCQILYTQMFISDNCIVIFEMIFHSSSLYNEEKWKIITSQSNFQAKDTITDKK